MFVSFLAVCIGNPPTGGIGIACQKKYFKVSIKSELLYMNRFILKDLSLAMDRNQTVKLSSLSDDDIRKVLNMIDFDGDTDNEEENEDDLDEDPCEYNEIDMGINEVVGMSESVLQSAICLDGSTASMLSPSTSNTSNNSPIPKRKRRPLAIIDPKNITKNKGAFESRVSRRHATDNEPTENNVNDAGAFVGSVLDINPKSEAFKNILWRQKNLVLNKSAISFCDPDLEEFKSFDTPYKCFEYFLNDEIITHIVQQTNIYAAQKNIATTFTTNNLEMRQFIGILIFMSVFNYPSIRSYWSNYAFQSIQDTMSRNRFDQIRSNIHFNDNSKLPAKNSSDFDPLYKIRPITKHFNEKFQSVPMPQYLCVDEQMCATKMKSFLRQYMPDKPHKWGVKLFVLCDSSGFCYNFEVYGGAGDNVIQPGAPDLGASSNVVVRLSRVVPAFKNHIIIFDNYYTSLPLLVFLRSRGIYSMGTIRSNRIPNCKLPTDNDLKKHPRGYSTEFCGSAANIDISLTLWKDNKAVRLASTYVGVKPFQNEASAKTTVSRFVRSEKKFVDIECPNAINEYNSHMGGVDHIDGLIGRYKITWKTEKYTNRIFTHLIDVAMVNSYILFHRINNPDPNDKQYQLPNFRAQVAQVLCTLKNVTKGAGRPRAAPQNKGHGKKTFLPPVEIRFDGVEHFPEFLPRNGGKKTCKNPGCASETQVMCRKCKINLCFSQQKDCFFDFHHK